MGMIDNHRRERGTKPLFGCGIIGIMTRRAQYQQSDLVRVGACHHYIRDQVCQRCVIDTLSVKARNFR
jgi:hypothetical protein